MKKILAILPLFIASLLAYPQSNAGGYPVNQYQPKEVMVKKLKTIGYETIPNASQWLVKSFPARDISKFPNITGYVIKCALGYVNDEGVFIAPMEIKAPDSKNFKILKSPVFITKEGLMAYSKVKEHPYTKIVLHEKALGILLMPDKSVLLISLP